MATFIVKNNQDRNLFLKADRFIFEANSGNYNFYTTGKDDLVASVPSRDVFAVLDKEALDFEIYDADFYNGDTEKVESMYGGFFEIDPPIEEDES